MAAVVHARAGSLEAQRAVVALGAEIATHKVWRGEKGAATSRPVNAVQIVDVAIDVLQGRKSWSVYGGLAGSACVALQQRCCCSLRT